ncbi:MAG: ABC transporter ATP-binding protein [Thermoanaerobaculia bacterium]|nr:ABC transporter ATP-binding protein [Thermoanaerobaculia bacterium]
MPETNDIDETPDAPAIPDGVLLQVEDLHKSYGDFEVLRGVSFELRRGDSLAVLGRSGTGKSVTLRQLNGLEIPDQGRVTFDGIEINELSEKELVPVRRRIGMLFQGGALFDSMTVLDNVAYPLREHTSWSDDEIAERVEHKLELVRLPGIGHKMPADLSGGMRKRVALARSLALDPELMLYDEPTTGLDPVTSSAIGQLILRTQDDLGVSSLVVTHDLPLARTVARRIAFLHGGSFRFLGTWEEADSSPDSMVRDFLAGRAEIEDAA